MQHVFRDGVWWPKLTFSRTSQPELKQEANEQGATPPNTPSHTSGTEFELNHEDVENVSSPMSPITPFGAAITFDDVFDTNSTPSQHSSIHDETCHSYSPNKDTIESKSTPKNFKNCVNEIDCANYFSGINSPKKKAICEERHLFIKPQFTTWCF